MSDKNQFKKEKGQSLLELVIVTGIVVIIVGALVFATIFSIRNAQSAQNQIQATKLAQEALELVRTGRDRNQPIDNFSPITTWNKDAESDSQIWTHQISNICTPPANCFFSVESSSAMLLGKLNFLSAFTPTATKLVPDGAEDISPFKRAIIISDDPGNDTDGIPFYQKRKTVTAIVTWTDPTGPHQSKLTTILGKTR